MKTFAKIVFKSMFTKHLLLTNTLVSGSLMGAGDCLQQGIERFGGKAKHDWRRTGRMVTLGLIEGPFVHGWYKFLDSAFVGTTKMMVAKKVVMDQALASPVLLTGFFLGMGTLEGKSFNDTVQELKDKFVFVYLVDCCFWPPAQTINFFHVPAHLRVAYVSMAVVAWNAFLSYIKHKDHFKDDTVESPALINPLPEKSSILRDQQKCIEYTK